LVLTKFFRQKLPNDRKQFIFAVVYSAQPLREKKQLIKFDYAATRATGCFEPYGTPRFAGQVRRIFWRRRVHAYSTGLSSRQKFIKQLFFNFTQ
jgi:hypothetical protein